MTDICGARRQAITTSLDNICFLTKDHTYPSHKSARGDEWKETSTEDEMPTEATLPESERCSSTLESHQCVRPVGHHGWCWYKGDKSSVGQVPTEDQVARTTRRIAELQEDNRRLRKERDRLMEERADLKVKVSSLEERNKHQYDQITQITALQGPSDLNSLSNAPLTPTGMQRLEAALQRVEDLEKRRKVLIRDRDQLGARVMILEETITKLRKELEEYEQHTLRRMHAGSERLEELEKLRAELAASKRIEEHCREMVQALILAAERMAQRMGAEMEEAPKTVGG
jgi:regulator of replication initiation timing